MNKKTAKAICKQINEWIDLASEAHTEVVSDEYHNKAEGLRKSLDIAGVQYEVDNWGKCFID